MGVHHPFIRLGGVVKTLLEDLSPGDKLLGPSYQKGKDVAQVTVRALFEDQDGVNLFLDYLVRTDLPLHVQGRYPVIMSGRVEADENVEKYRWLNRTQVVGKGYLAAERRTQTYDMYALAWS